MPTGTNATVNVTVADLMWQGDQDTLQEIAPCGCCCADHTSAKCPARAWHGCRGQVTVMEDEVAWAAFYEKTRDMTRDEFFGVAE